MTIFTGLLSKAVGLIRMTPVKIHCCTMQLHMGMLRLLPSWKDSLVNRKKIRKAFILYKLQCWKDTLLVLNCCNRVCNRCNLKRISFIYYCPTFKDPMSTLGVCSTHGESSCAILTTKIRWQARTIYTWSVHWVRKSTSRGESYTPL